jgi:hypothetical protein
MVFFGEYPFFAPFSSCTLSFSSKEIMSRDNGEQEQYHGLRYINGPISHSSAVYHLSSAINGVVNDTETRALEGISCNNQGSDTKPYSYVMGSVGLINVNSSHQEAFLQPDKSLLNSAHYYNQPLQTSFGAMQSTDMIGQVAPCSSLPSASGYYQPEYLATDYYTDPYRVLQDQTANSYLMENTVISKETIRLSPIKFCSNCFTTETPSWRRCSEGKNLLCNACGL